MIYKAIAIELQSVIKIQFCKDFTSTYFDFPDSGFWHGDPFNF